MWKTLRITVLLLILFIVAVQQVMDRVNTQGWQETLWVGVYPLNADGSAQAEDYIAGLTQKDFGDIESFFAREGQRYGLKARQPIHIELYPGVRSFRRPLRAIDRAQWPAEAACPGVQLDVHRLRAFSP